MNTAIETSKTKTALGKRLRAARAAAGFTLKQLSQKTGYAIGYLSDIERGKTDYSLRILVCCSDILRVDLLWLKTGKGEMVPSDLAAKRLTHRAAALLSELEAQAHGSDLANPGNPLFDAIAKLRAGLATIEQYESTLKTAQKSSGSFVARHPGTTQRQPAYPARSRKT